MIEEFETIARAHCNSTCRDWRKQNNRLTTTGKQRLVFPHGEVISCCALLWNKASVGLFPLTNEKKKDNFFPVFWKNEIFLSFGQLIDTGFGSNKYFWHEVRWVLLFSLSLFTTSLTTIFFYTTDLLKNLLCQFLTIVMTGTWLDQFNNKSNVWCLPTNS